MKNPPQIDTDDLTQEGAVTDQPGQQMAGITTKSPQPIVVRSAAAKPMKHSAVGKRRTVREVLRSA